MKLNHTVPAQKYLISQKDLAEKLGMSVDAMRKLQKNDPNFPAMIKLGTTRQAAVFYSAAEVPVWIDSKKLNSVSEISYV